jgi:hypothetical protein
LAISKRGVEYPNPTDTCGLKSKLSRTCHWACVHMQNNKNRRETNKVLNGMSKAKFIQK